MVIDTFSAFYYGHLITRDNQIIPFDEGGGEINAVIPVGSYTLTNFIAAVASALNDSGLLDYQVTVDRETRLITISASGNFSLLFGSSTQTEISCRELLGFDLVDYAGDDSYSATEASGSAYYPQFKLQNFYDFSTIKRPNSATVRTTASGQVEVLKYANSRFMRCTITFITNIANQSVIKNNPQGVQDALDFMNYATDKLGLEFIYDVNNPGNYVSCILESTQSNNDGAGFELEPLYSRGLTGYYELRDLLFREVS
jgi:hypothetical protein